MVRAGPYITDRHYKHFTMPSGGPEGKSHPMPLTTDPLDLRFELKVRMKSGSLHVMIALSRDIIFAPLRFQQRFMSIIPQRSPVVSRIVHMQTSDTSTSLQPLA